MPHNAICNIEFNTPFLYRTSMTVQSSTDMLRFGGDCFKTQDGHFIHYWWKSEQYDIYKYLKDLEKICRFKKPININKFPRSQFGTFKLQVALWKIVDLHNTIQHCYMLGAIIYHQLSYNPTLMAKYDLYFDEVMKIYIE